MPSTPIGAVANVVRYNAAKYSHKDMDIIKDDWVLGKRTRGKNNAIQEGVGLDQHAIDHGMTSELNGYIEDKGGTNLLLPGSLTETTTILAAATKVHSRLP